MHKTLFAALAVATPLTLAAEPSYDYLEASYLNVDGDLDGFGVAGSVSVAPTVHLYGEFDHAEDGPLEVQTAVVAAGLNHGLSDTTDVVGRLGWAKGWVDVGAVDADDHGVMAEVGLRTALSDTFEVNGFLRHVDVADADPSLAIGGVFGLSPAFGVVGDVEFTEDDTMYRVGLRYSFPS